MTKINKTEEQWKKELTPEEYKVLRGKGTETPFSGKFLDEESKSSMFTCKACGARLFDGNTKFDSGTGWPSFDKALPGAVEYLGDSTLGMNRSEIVCATCSSHLGHVFSDGPTETGQRLCVNSICLSREEK